MQPPDADAFAETFGGALNGAFIRSAVLAALDARFFGGCGNLFFGRAKRTGGGSPELAGAARGPVGGSPGLAGAASGAGSGRKASSIAKAPRFYSATTNKTSTVMNCTHISLYIYIFSLIYRHIHIHALTISDH